MKFYDREKELNELEQLYLQAENSGRMTVLTGRRRVGKTLLSLNANRSHRYIYLFVSKKSEPLLCMEFLQEIRKVVEVPVTGEIRRFKDIFKLILELSRHERFTLIVDEFQEFYNINPAVYSEIQNLWDLYKAQCHLNLIFIGSIYSLMHKIFENSREPLFERADRLMFIRPFKIKVIRDILQDYGVSDIRSIFDMFVFTGGVPRYIEILCQNQALSFGEILDFLLDENSPFINEGKNLLIEEFGKDYGTYFSILELISVGKTARTEIESILESNVGGYLERLKNDYAIVSRVRPINARPKSRGHKYRINDNFLNLWFRFIHRNRSAVETGNFDYIKTIFERDYTTYCGHLLEKFFHQLFADTRQYNRIGSYWERGNQNEIDLVAISDLKKEMTIAEIKFNKSRIRLEQLKMRAQKLLDSYPGFTPHYLALSLDDAADYL